MEYAVNVQNLTHQFGAFKAVDDMTFHIRRGEVFGLLGPNGAGKTTTVRLLNGLYTPAQGSIEVLGLDPRTQGNIVRRRTGILTETPANYERLTARQNLEFFGTLAGMEANDLRRRIDELLTFFGLEKRANERVGKFSKGMKQRLALARAFLHRPELIYLDEPTSGLDPESAQQVRELIESIRKQDGHTVFLCTHHLDEAQRLCDRLAILNRGRILALGSLEELSRRLSPGLWIEIGLWMPLPEGKIAYERLPGVLQAEYDSTVLRLQVNGEAEIPAIVRSLVEAGAQVVRVQPKTTSLEDIYFKLQAQERGEA
jgi:ABC-2 type transport system ATP-binding protein